MKLWSVKGKEVELRFNEPQQQAWDSDKRFTFIIAGTQVGKSTFLPWWLWREIQRRGTGDYLAVTASFDLFKLKFLPEMRTIFEHVLKIGRYWAGDKVIELCEGADVGTGGKYWAKRAADPMWGRIILRSAQSEGGLESATAKAAILDECGQDGFTLTDWEAVLRRLSLHQGPVMAATTPYNIGWLKTEVYDRWLAGDEDYMVIQAPSVANPAFPQTEYERAKRTMPTWRFNMMYRGLFERPAGLIYGDYDSDAHDVDPFPIPLEWPRYVGVDFGANNQALVWLAEDVERKAYYIYRESLEGGKTTKEHAASAKEHTQHERVVKWSGGAPSEMQWRWDWTAEGVPIAQPSVSDVEVGIDRVTALWREKRLFLFNTLRGLKDELGSYRRKLGPDGQITEKIHDKARFHRLDALRYVVSDLETLGPLFGYA